jgi:hypothetical protein
LVFSGGVRPWCASVFPIRNIFVPQTEQVPEVPGVPVFVKTACGESISRFSLHFTQYASKTILQ